MDVNASHQNAQQNNVNVKKMGSCVAQDVNVKVASITNRPLKVRDQRTS